MTFFIIIYKQKSSVCKYVSDSMDCIKKNVDTLFSKAENMNPTELETNFNAIMEEAEKSIEQSGK